MRLLRTNLINWKVEMPPKQANWLRLIDEAEEVEEESLQPDAPAPEDCPTPPPIAPDELFGPKLDLPRNLLTNPERFAALAVAH